MDSNVKDVNMSGYQEKRAKNPWSVLNAKAHTGINLERSKNFFDKDDILIIKTALTGIGVGLIGIYLDINEWIVTIGIILSIIIIIFTSCVHRK